MSYNRIPIENLEKLQGLAQHVAFLNIAKGVNLANPKDLLVTLRTRGQLFQQTYYGKAYRISM